MEAQMRGAFDEMMPRLITVINSLEEMDLECEMTLFLPAREDSPALGNPAVRVGEDIFTLSPLETDDDDVCILSITRPFAMEDDKILFKEWEFPWIGDEIDAQELRITLRLFDEACERGYFGSDAMGMPDGLYIMPRLRGLYYCLAEIGASPEYTGDDTGAAVRIVDREITFTLSYLRTDEPESWILVIECLKENEEKRIFRIPEFGGLKDPQEYGRLLEATGMLLQLGDLPE